MTKYDGKSSQPKLTFKLSMLDGISKHYLFSRVNK